MSLGIEFFLSLSEKVTVNTYHENFFLSPSMKRLQHGEEKAIYRIYLS